MASVFIIESDLAFANALDGALKDRGHQATVLDDGNVAVSQAGKEPPDAIVLCAELPKLSGFSVCNRLKRDAKLQAIPVILISSSASEETFEQHRRLPKKSAQAYLHKPIDVSDLIGTVEELLGIELPSEAPAPAPPASEQTGTRSRLESGVIRESQRPPTSLDDEAAIDALLDGKPRVSAR
jgi:DNA-binding response OmpR family regulator